MFVALSGPLVSRSVRFVSVAAARQFFPRTCGIYRSTIGGSRTLSSSSRNSRRMASAAVAKGAAGRRAEAGTAHTLGATGHIGGPFTPTKDAPFIKRRLEVFQRLMAKQQQDIKGKSHEKITIELPDGSKREGVCWETTPMQVAAEISKGLANAAVIAKVAYADSAAGSSSMLAAADDETTGAAAEESCCGGDESEAEAEHENIPWQLWDMARPLEGSCKLQILKFDSPEAQNVFWHSSAHILGQALECEFGALLTVGPALKPGFYYDCYMGQKSLSESEHGALNAAAQRIVSEAQPFERLVCTKEEALEMFAENPFKVALITTKVPDGGLTTVYRCGTLVDICRGPHLPTTALCKSFSVTRHSAAYWLGNSSNDSLQRVYGVSFPEKKQLKEYLDLLEKAKERDHRLLGNNLSLFFFEPTVSAGSAFWLPEGAKVYNKLIEFIRKEYQIRGFKEVITPNIFSCDLWKTSGHYDNYKENMFLMDVEGKEWGLKPMNCPGHCVMFRHLAPSYRQLPLRLADFGVLHRNEASGSLSGLTRVRRFQQDDAHIFCTMEQIEAEVVSALEFLFYVYEQFGFSFSLFLSTRPAKAMGSVETWKQAEAALRKALVSLNRPWKLNPGDGAFYGPKIDIQLWDALKRPHQCGTIQLDFQLPIRFNLQYKTHEETAAAAAAAAANKKAQATETTPKMNGDAANGNDDNQQRFQEGHLKPGMARPVIIHRAILGSIERMCAVLLEHSGGKFPFWLSPRQCIVLPISDKVAPYAEKVMKALQREGYEVGIDLSNNTINKKIREAQLQQWNLLLVVGEAEAAAKTVTVRDRADPKQQECLSMPELLEKLRKLAMPSSQPPLDLNEWKREDA
ncbi:threonyl-tRNA synthetase, putative [Eimeria necatrix]|uniref:threonine--tRNA ligase n=1 Tax=Eimeria necatrix TaxID=51315 RepID=U6N0J6_9EIME|nr:threonyl-tRNA synthetase, putative [Eimeria necatrix]CDJ67465.1 threonyl-tRNA synthetase, putative [Eimeria necatrix]